MAGSRPWPWSARFELFFQEGSSDKVYNAKIVGAGDRFDVVVAWGRRGAGLNEGRKAVGVSRAEADKQFDRLVREKRGKGYEERTAERQPAAIAPPDGEGSGSKVTSKRAKVGVAAQLLVALDDDELAAVLADDAMVAQQKLDGVRVLVHRGDALVATNRDGQVTELAGAALAGLDYLPRDTIVDGEVLGDAFWLFDVLRLAGDDVRGRGYLERHALLDSELEPALTAGAAVLPVAIGGKRKPRCSTSCAARAPRASCSSTATRRTRAAGRRRAAPSASTSSSSPPMSSSSRMPATPTGWRSTMAGRWSTSAGCSRDDQREPQGPRRAARARRAPRRRGQLPVRDRRREAVPAGVRQDPR